jgi:hypothetical protein
LAVFTHAMEFFKKTWVWRSQFQNIFSQVYSAICQQKTW